MSLYRSIASLECPHCAHLLLRSLSTSKPALTFEEADARRLCFRLEQYIAGLTHLCLWSSSCTRAVGRSTALEKPQYSHEMADSPPPDVDAALPGVPVINILLGSIAAVVVALRLYTRLYIKPSAGWDDVLIVLGLVSVLLWCFNATGNTNRGLRSRSSASPIPSASSSKSTMANMATTASI